MLYNCSKKNKPIYKNTSPNKKKHRYKNNNKDNYKRVKQNIFIK